MAKSDLENQTENLVREFCQRPPKRKSFRCRLGWHNWTWSLVRGQVIELGASPPPHARCSRCDALYEKGEEDGAG